MEDEYMGGRRGMEGEAAQKARARAKSNRSIKEAADSIREIDPELGYAGNIRRIIGKQLDMNEAMRESKRVSSETGYAKGGMVRGCGKAVKGKGKGKMY